ncbi:MAG TPA: asparaginase [Stackebrandtia sp.]|uniref:asparaginase n=1 Tax=Stackebrandtia sp. TaxID=2023065 RepID=UPI002D2A0892|nr:asparaginase [Stackebrandtia sp.]HZE41626.1 asparaginase [Stackebrandtia sp.]
MIERYRGGQPLAEVVRSDFVEGLHRGSVVVLGPDGSVLARAGDVDGAVFPRSSNKPMQTVGALRSGLTLDDPRDVALVSASHRGETFHIARVRAILDRAGLGPEDLGCPPDLPVDPESRDVVVAAGRGPSRLAMNCSGKHAGMLATCVANGWSTHDYLDPAHPLQRANFAAVEDLTGDTIVATGIDGCGAPLFAFGLTGLARAFRRLVHAEAGTHERAVADAMRAHPELVSGTRGFDTRLMRAVPGLLCKGGAEGVVALAIPDVGAVAVKVDDGAARAARPVAVAALRCLLDLSGIDTDKPVLDELATSPLLGGGGEVGSVRPVWPI